MPPLAQDNLRPDALSGFVGQTRLRGVLDIAIKGANHRHEPMGHTLFVGPPGLGKTTLANIIAHETNKPAIIASATSITRIPTLATILNQIQDGGAIVFIDEIHRLPRMVEEALYPVMEDFRLDVTTDKLHINMRVPKFTLVGATTRQGLITRPLHDRFIGKYSLDWYTSDELVAIINRAAGILQLTIEDRAAAAIATRCKQTPRLANNLLLQARDFANSHGIEHISYPVVLGMFEQLELDELGLTRTDRDILQAIAKLGPVGLDTLAAMLSEEPDVLERSHEPYLMRLALITRTPRGRTITNAGRAHLRLPPQPEPIVIDPNAPLDLTDSE